MPIHSHSPSGRKDIAQAIGVGVLYVYQVQVGIRAPSPALARRWNAYEPKDRLWDLRPSDWWQIWPELIGAEGAPSVQEQVIETEKNNG